MGRDYSVIGRALAAPARSAMLDLLMDGSARPAGELAVAARVKPSAASEHLAALVGAGLLRCDAHGRLRRYRIADPAIGRALEQIGHLCASTPVRSLRQSREQRDLARARLCYDHLAGRLGVALTDALIERGWLEPADLRLTDVGEQGVAGRGIDLLPPRRSTRPVTLSCRDWTERRPHLAGALGAAIARHLLDQEWVRRRQSGRGLDITAPGREGLLASWGVEVDRLAG
ncbi:MAG: helix-turn-helix domain-containing protein [Actinomycetota bacterium]|jgi:DNA-binding transcriptional ArsR family regulator|nr:helix-turn-helix domain-containing protein [Actinomycetota bacterium]